MKCTYCHQEITEGQSSTSIGIAGEEHLPFHGDCFPKAMDKVKSKITGGSGMVDAATVGMQRVIDPETGEILDEVALKELYTETAVTGKQFIHERCKIGEYVKVTVLAQIVATGQSLDDKKLLTHFQKAKVISIEDVQRGAL